MATDSNCEGSPSFFKVVLNPSSPHLSLPKAFVKANFKKIPKNPTLKTETGEHSWKLEITKIGEDYCFAHGWEKLVKDVPLRSRDIVVFWLIDPCTFKVLFLDADGCDKDLPVSNANVNVVNGHNEEDENLSFEKVISLKTNKYHILLPKKFIASAGLEDSTGLMVKDHEGKEWIMRIMVEKYDRTKYYLSAGWLNFRVYHQLSDGDICVFKFNKKEGVMYLVHLIKNNKTIRQENEVTIEDKWSPTEKHCGSSSGGVEVKVKVEDESGTEMPLKQAGGGVEVKIEDEVDQGVAVVKRKMGRPPLGGSGGGVAEKVEPVERLVRSKFVVYF